MKPSRILSILPALGKAKQPTMLWGAPGVGKSDLIKQFAKQYGDFIDLRLPLLDAVDMRGIPSIQDGKTVWMTPDMFPKKGKGVLFLDELPQAMPIVQSAASQLILDRKIGEYSLPDGWMIIAAGNRDSDRAATNRMPSHIANRFTHLDYEVDYEDWYTWAYANGVNPMVIAFLQFKPELLHKFDPKVKAFPTPRSWGFVSNLLNTGDIDEGLLEIVSGTIGEGAAGEFIGFVRVFRELPDYDTIKRRPETCKVPEAVEVKYAIASMLAALTQPGDMKQVIKYIARLPSEFQILATQEMTHRNKRLTETAAYIGWAAENAKLMLNATAR